MLRPDAPLPRLAAVLAFALVLGPSPALAAPAGTLADPLVVDQFPYAHASTTVGRPESIDAYSCDTSKAEHGGEVVYRFQTAAAGRLFAWVEGDSASVDVDVQLLDGATVAGGVAQDCLARNNTSVDLEIAAGTFYVVVDTYGSSPEPGPYVLHLDFNGKDAWRDRTVAQGVVWRRRLYTDLMGGTQTINVLDVDLSAEGLTVKPVDANDCEKTSAMGRRVAAVAGVNGGFFDMNAGNCPSESLIKVDGVLAVANIQKRTTFGMKADGTAAIQQIAGGADWPEMVQALGAGPNLVTASAADVTRDEGFSWIDAANPRTTLGLTADNHLLLVTVDGRTEYGAGAKLPELADWMLAELGVVNAMNLDGGGSTTLWIDGVTPNGVANYPVGGVNGERAVSSGLYVWAAPYDHPPRFTSAPPTAAVAGTVWTYDAEALDLDVGDALTFARQSGPAGMTVDAASGLAQWTPGWREAGQVQVTLTVADRTTTVAQTFAIAVTAPDADGDGMADGFEAEYGVDDPAADPDGDSFSNLDEFKAGTDPTDPASRPGGPSDAGAAPDATTSSDAAQGEDAAGADGGATASAGRDAAEEAGAATSGCGTAAGASPCGVLALAMAALLRRRRR